LATTLWLQTLLTVGWLYEVYAIFMQFIAAILGVELIGTWLLRKRVESSRLIRAAHPALALLSAALCAGFVVASDFAMRSVEPSTRRIWPAAPAYIRAEDRARVAEYLKALAGEGKPLSVTFLPDADALVFQDLRSSAVHFSQPAFGVELADVYIFHDSIWLPKLLRDFMLARLAFSHGIPVLVEEWQVIHARDTTESWRVYRRPPESP
jgi:hypothetical protein